MAEEIKNQGQQENAENLNENVSGQAKEIISAALEETQNRETSDLINWSDSADEIEKAVSLINKFSGYGFISEDERTSYMKLVERKRKE